MRKVPISKCRRCVRFRRGYCPLEDLEPCDFVPDPKKSDAAVDAFLFCVTVIGLSAIVACFCLY